MAFPLFTPLHRRVPRKIADAVYITDGWKKRATCRASDEHGVI